MTFNNCARIPEPYEYPPVLLSTAFKSDSFPYSDGFENAPIPSGIKPFIISPLDLVLRLDFPHSPIPTQTPSFPERIGHTSAVLRKFTEQDSVDAVKPDDLSLAFTVHNMKPNGYEMKPQPPPTLPPHYSTTYHAGFEVYVQFIFLPLSSLFSFFFFQSLSLSLPSFSLYFTTLVLRLKLGKAF